MKKSILKRRWLKNNTAKQSSFNDSQVLKGLTQGEKSFNAIEKLNKYSFVVPTQVNKIDIANSFEEIYGVKPLAVNTMILPSKSGSKRLKRRSFKKAVITVTKDSKIEIA